MLDFCKRKDRNYQLMFAILLAIVVYAPALAQMFYTGISNMMALDNDQYFICYPNFVRLGYYLRRGIISAADFITCNAGSNFYTRADVPEMYMPMMVFALLGNITNQPEVCLTLFYMFQFFLGAFFAQKVAVEYFCLSKKTGVLLACSCAPIFCWTSWYTSWATITTLVFPTLYFGLSFERHSTFSNGIRFFFILLLAYTSGYPVVSLFMVVVIYIFLTIYTLSKIRIKSLFWITGCFVASGMACLLHYLYIYLAVRTSPSGVTVSIYDAFYYQIAVHDFLKLFFDSYNTPIEINEYIDVFYLSVIWLAAIIAIVMKKRKAQLQSEIRNCLFFIIGINFALLLVTFTTDSPFGYWFYSFVPVIGQTHIPLRYMLVTMPLLFLALCILFEHAELSAPPPPIRIKYVSYAFGILCILLAVLNQPLSTFLPFNMERLILELAASGLIFYFIYRFGWYSRYTVVLWCLLLFSVGSLKYYDKSKLAVSQNNLTSMHLETFSWDYEIFNTYVDTYFPDKDYIRYTSLKNMGWSDTPYAHHNFPWLGMSEKGFVNYMTYDMRIASFPGYFNKIPYNISDWDYFMNTRPDFLILSQETMNGYSEILNEIVDWDKSPYWIKGGEYRILTLKKYVPSTLTGQELLLDGGNSRGPSLDNGIFYSVELTDDSLLEFSTDEGTYVSAVIDAPTDAVVVFLEWANPYFQYYLDGDLYEPRIDNDQALFYLTAGQHSIEIKYMNRAEFWGNMMVIISYVFALAGCAVTGLRKKLHWQNISV